MERQRRENLVPYLTQHNWSQLLAFGIGCVRETITGRSLSKLMQRRLGKQHLAIRGLDNLPRTGTFILAVNHYRGGLSLDVVAALMMATRMVRPELQDDYLVVIGQRVRLKSLPVPRAVKLLRETARNLYRRWSKHLLLVPIGNDRPDIRALREWRQRTRQQPVIVFPEGSAGLEFETIRRGAGRWLASLLVPTVPVAVWWYETAWHVRFGQPLKWSQRPELHDLQLGLAIAALLPSKLVSVWQEDLRRWRLVHTGKQFSE